MQEKELEKLQRYIYKRAKGQTTRECIEQIVKVNKKEHLSKAEWNKLLIPTCSCMDTELFQWLLHNGASVEDDLIQLSGWIVGSQENRLAYQKNRVELLRILFGQADDEVRRDALGNALINACWFNNIYAVYYLITSGADIDYLSPNGKTPYECAEKYGERFGDYNLYTSLKEYKKTGIMPQEPEKFYTGTDILGDKVYQI